MRLLEPTAQIWMKIDPYYQPQKCRPMTLVSENIRFMRIFMGVPLGRGIKRHWGLSMTAIFGWFRWLFYTSSKTSEMRQAMLCDDMLPLVDLLIIAKWMTLNDLEWLFHDKMRFLPALLESERLNVSNSTTTTSAILRCSVHCTIS